MNLIDKIKALFAIKRSINNIKEEVKMNPTKPVYKSTRFWFNIATNVVSVVGAIAVPGLMDIKTATIIIALSNAFYQFMKTLEAQPSITTLVDNSVTNK